MSPYTRNFRRELRYFYCLNTVRLDTSQDAEDILRCACCQDTASPNTYIFLTRPRPRESLRQQPLWPTRYRDTNCLEPTQDSYRLVCLLEGIILLCLLHLCHFMLLCVEKKAFRLFLPFSSRPSASPGRPRLGMSYLES